MNSPTHSRPPGETTIAILTPPGRGAVAAIGLRGPRAMELVARRFVAAANKPLTAFPAGSVVFGRFRGLAPAEEELVVGLLAADDVEVHCHGGWAAAESVAAALVAEGATRVDWREWTALVEPDSLAAEARLALAEARTERTAAILLDQFRGALRTAAGQIAASLRSRDLASAGEALERLVSRAELSRHLTRPWRVVLAGRPNAGKSSLMNALLGFQRSIVFAEPGTTRDVLTQTTAFEGWPVELADTAGLRRSGEPIEAEGVERARAQFREADLVLLLCDVTTAWSEPEQEVLAIARRALVVHHKCDLAEPSAGRPAGIAVSSLTGQGIDLLCQRIAQALVPNPPEPGAAVPFTDRQESLLQRALAAVMNSEAQNAIDALAGLSQPPCAVRLAAEVHSQYEERENSQTPSPKHETRMPLRRILETEVMDTPEEARDYDAMDHSAVNRVFVDDLLAAIADWGSEVRGQRSEVVDRQDSATSTPQSEIRNPQLDILDLGTGTAQIPIELCRRYEHCRVMACDAAANMLQQAQYNLAAVNFNDRIQLRQVDAKALPFHQTRFDVVMSNSIVHHIPEPVAVLREAVRVARPGGLLFFRDLLRPASEDQRQQLVAKYAADCNDHQRQMFADSLHAALTLEEVRDLVAGLGFDRETVQQTSDRHWTWTANC